MPPRPPPRPAPGAGSPVGAAGVVAAAFGSGTRLPLMSPPTVTRVAWGASTRKVTRPSAAISGDTNAGPPRPRPGDGVPAAGAPGGDCCVAGTCATMALAESRTRHPPVKRASEALVTSVSLATRMRSKQYTHCPPEPVSMCAGGMPWRNPIVSRPRAPEKRSEPSFRTSSRAKSLNSVATWRCRSSGRASCTRRPTSYESRSTRGPADPRLQAANRLVVENYAEQRGVDLEIAVVVDEPEISELVHEEIDARARRPDHFGKGLLRDLRYSPFRSLLVAVPRQQQERPRQPLFTGVEQMIDEVGFDAERPLEHV